MIQPLGASLEILMAPLRVTTGDSSFIPLAFETNEYPPHSDCLGGIPTMLQRSYFPLVRPVTSAVHPASLATTSGGRWRSKGR